MEYLRNNKELFCDILEDCYVDTGISRAIIEKDDYVSLLQKIAFACGFHSTSDFIKKFKEKTGILPYQIQKKKSMV